MTALATVNSAQPAIQEAPPIVSMIERIMTDPQVSVERVNQAFDFYQRVKSEAACKAYLQAKAAFKENAPEIIKDKKNKQFDSSYASIGNVVNTTNEELGKHGLDASWQYDQSDKTIKVTCVLRHVDGHSESVTLSAPPDSSGSKNPIQQIKSTLTYLKLATFEAVTGIATKEGNVDDDGNSAVSSTSVISDDQSEELRNLITETRTDIGKFLEFARAESLSDVQAKDFPRLKAMLLKRKSEGRK